MILRAGFSASRCAGMASMMPMTIFDSGRFGPRRDDRRSTVAEWPMPG